MESNICPQISQQKPVEKDLRRKDSFFRICCSVRIFLKIPLQYQQSKYKNYHKCRKVLNKNPIFIP
jgi:hypothetical protein